MIIGIILAILVIYIIIQMHITIRSLRKEILLIKTLYYNFETRFENARDYFYNYKFEQNKLNKMFKAHLNFIVDEEDKNDN